MQFEQFLLEAGLDSSYISSWDTSEVIEATGYLKPHLKKLVGSSVHVGAASNQAIGNKAADWLIGELENVSTTQWTSKKSDVASGYPDAFALTPENLVFLEIKSSSSWDLSDSNRRVLLSSPDRMRGLVRKYGALRLKKHMLISIDYSNVGDHIEIQGFHIAFLQPDFQVSKRVEASTSQKDLGALSADLIVDV
jgi:hypothetical protein